MQPLVPAPVHPDQVLQGLAVNPALPVALVRRLLPDRSAGHRAAQFREDLTEELIEEIIGRGDDDLVHSLACNWHLPPEVQARLADSPEDSVRAAIVIRGKELPRRVWERVVTDPSTEVRKFAAANAHLPSDLRSRFAGDPDADVRAELAQWWTDAPEEVRRALLTDPEATVRAAACSTYFRRLPHPVPPADLHPALLADPATRAGVVAHLRLDADTARDLAGDPDEDVRRAVAAHPELPPPLRDLLATDPEPRVRVEVFARRDTPEETRAAIHAEVHAGSDPARADLLASDEQGFSYYLAYLDLVRRHIPWAAEAPLDHLDSPYVAFRRSAAASDALPAETLAPLLDDEDSGVRAIAARRIPVLDPVTAERVERRHRENRKVRGGLRPADRVVFPRETLHRFATDPDPRIRDLAPRDPGLPAALAERLAVDGATRVRRAVIGHPNLPVPALLALVADPDAYVARAAAESPTLPVEAMEGLLAHAGL
ncbi:hypothetical protein [Streptomyces sp. NPDC096132]|uniref:hypothetical protein n=1 Tax=Streptomyces sp. NPDC096132 TaxID=3366075 RepID=UPI0037F3C784